MMVCFNLQVPPSGKPDKCKSECLTTEMHYTVNALSGLEQEHETPHKVIADRLQATGGTVGSMSAKYDPLSFCRITTLRRTWRAGTHNWT